MTSVKQIVIAILLLTFSHLPLSSSAVGRGFPTDFPMVGFIDFPLIGSFSRGFPTDFPMVGYQQPARPDLSRRGFPTDFPMVG